jgi:hypothetical protein
MVKHWLNLMANLIDKFHGQTLSKLNTKCNG